MTARAFAILLCLLPWAVAAAPLSNQLKNHPSPYLAMHATDPVAWQDWNAAAVERARREGKLLYVSVGYFSCHWCHVMQRESYKNKDIARFLNRHFIPVKVDRELEPALDARLIEFAERTRGLGGWPLNVFVTPAGYPVYAALYLPPAEFKQVLERLQGLWTGDPAGLERLAQDEAARAAAPVAAPAGKARTLVQEALAQADTIHGGFGEQSKFPSAPQLEALLAQQAAKPDARLEEFLRLTLDGMADLGLHDHLGGGFFRYTVDPSWKTPHFEKMLYDNALLARVYLHAAKVLRQPRYEAVARATLDFMARDLRAPDGALIASLSAVDDQNVEGGYYLWSADQLDRLLATREARAYRLVYGMQDAAPFEAGYLPLRVLATPEAAKRLGVDPSEVESLLAQAAAKLHAARVKRGLPRDTKLLAGWNGLALAAFAEAARMTNEPRYREAANGIRKYLVGTLWDGRELKRAVDKGRAVGAVALEDYAYVAQGLLEWARLTNEANDFSLARAVANAAWRQFYSESGWRLGGAALIRTGTDEAAVADGPLPSPSAVLIEASLALAEKTGDAVLKKTARAALEKGKPAVRRDAFWNATHARLLAGSNK